MKRGALNHSISEPLPRGSVQFARGVARPKTNSKSSYLGGAFAHRAPELGEIRTIPKDCASLDLDLRSAARMAYGKSVKTSEALPAIERRNR